MPRDHFDLETVRKNWDRAVTPERASTPPKVVDDRVRRDPYDIGQEIFDRMRARALRDFESRAIALTPFFDHGARLLQQMRQMRQMRQTSYAASASQAAVAPEPEQATLDKTADGDQLQKLRGEFLKVLRDLEDLFEVFAEIGR